MNNHHSCRQLALLVKIVLRSPHRAGCGDGNEDEGDIVIHSLRVPLPFTWGDLHRYSRYLVHYEEGVGMGTIAPNPSSISSSRSTDGHDRTEASVQSAAALFRLEEWLLGDVAAWALAHVLLHHDTGAGGQADAYGHHGRRGATSAGSRPPANGAPDPHRGRRPDQGNDGDALPSSDEITVDDVPWKGPGGWRHVAFKLLGLIPPVAAIGSIALGDGMRISSTTPFLCFLRMCALNQGLRIGRYNPLAGAPGAGAANADDVILISDEDMDRDDDDNDEHFFVINAPHREKERKGISNEAAGTEYFAVRFDFIASPALRVALGLPKSRAVASGPAVTEDDERVTSYSAMLYRVARGLFARKHPREEAPAGRTGQNHSGRASREQLCAAEPVPAPGGEGPGFFAKLADVFHFLVTNRGVLAGRLQASGAAMLLDESYLIDQASNDQDEERFGYINPGLFHYWSCYDDKASTQRRGRTRTGSASSILKALLSSKGAAPDIKPTTFPLRPCLEYCLCGVGADALFNAFFVARNQHSEWSSSAKMKIAEKSSTPVDDCSVDPSRLVDELLLTLSPELSGLPTDRDIISNSDDPTSSKISSCNGPCDTRALPGGLVRTFNGTDYDSAGNRHMLRKWARMAQFCAPSSASAVGGGELPPALQLAASLRAAPPLKTSFASPAPALIPALVVPVVIGSAVQWLGTAAPSHANHGWVVYLRGAGGVIGPDAAAGSPNPLRTPLSGLIESVTFILHSSFQQNYIVVTEEPFFVSQVGWGEFEVGIYIKMKANATCASPGGASDTAGFTFTLNNDVQKGLRTSSVKRIHLAELNEIYNNNNNNNGNNNYYASNSVCNSQRGSTRHSKESGSSSEATSGQLVTFDGKPVYVKAFYLIKFSFRNNLLFSASTYTTARALMRSIRNNEGSNSNSSNASSSSPGGGRRAPKAVAGEVTAPEERPSDMCLSEWYFYKRYANRGNHANANGIPFHKYANGTTSLGGWATGPAEVTTARLPYLPNVGGSAGGDAEAALKQLRCPSVHHTRHCVPPLGVPFITSAAAHRNNAAVQDHFSDADGSGRSSAPDGGSRGLLISSTTNTITPFALNDDIIVSEERDELIIMLPVATPLESTGTADNGEVACAPERCLENTKFIADIRHDYIELLRQAYGLNRESTATPTAAAASDRRQGGPHPTFPSTNSAIFDYYKGFIQAARDYKGYCQNAPTLQEQREALIQLITSLGGPAGDGDAPVPTKERKNAGETHRYYCDLFGSFSPGGGGRGKRVNSSPAKEPGVPATGALRGAKLWLAVLDRSPLLNYGPQSNLNTNEWTIRARQAEYDRCLSKAICRELREMIELA